ncbi:hypothetical protein SESBI_04130 [Sesbania bispinosa]|nr:hypothetical protein SESBI_04130 [Sesbania bispinosa]
MKKLNQSKNGFWNVLARKAESITEDDNLTWKFEMPGTTRSQLPGLASMSKVSLELHLESSILKGSWLHVGHDPRNPNSGVGSKGLSWIAVEV